MYFRRIMAVLLVAILAFAAVACSSSEEKPGTEAVDSGDQQGGESKAPDASKPPEGDVELKGRIGIVYTMTGRGDMAFNDITYRGAMRAAEEFNLEVDHVEPKTLSEMEMAFEDMSSSGDYDLIVGISFEVLDALNRTAPEYPEQKYALVDTSIPLDNVVSFIAKENEAAFLSGVFAGLLNIYKPENGMVGDANVIGLVGAKDVEVINRHIAGYTCGAKYVNPDIEVLFDYVGNFSDTATAQTIAETMHNRGADVIYNVAAGAGLGMFKAAKEKGFIAIGLDNNQCHIDPDHIAGSMLKRVDEYVYSAIADVVKGEFKGGQTFNMGLAENGVGFTTEDSLVVIDPKIMEIVEKCKERVINGELKIPTTKEEIDDWVANHRYEW
ncbi:MAG TPA: BMP family ABC transporter substrate-binding protein [Clostridiaceae bacterium]|nr:BMP family ABC transporter substrate-binding protein [Clostridiaceae bacterium]